MSRTVIKVGGSLFDLPDLSQRLKTLLNDVVSEPCVLIAGGGSVADTIRAWDKCHRLGAERAHRLAVQSMSLTASFLGTLLPGVPFVRDREALRSANHSEQAILFDLATLVLATGCCPLPAAWDVTSDSLAAWLALETGAAKLILLKSLDLPEPQMPLTAASSSGLVDRYFPEVATRELRIDWINLRREPLTRQRWEPLSVGSEEQC